MNTLRTLILIYFCQNRAVQELFLNSSSRTVFEKFYEENGPFNIHELFFTVLGHILQAQF